MRPTRHQGIWFLALTTVLCVPSILGRETRNLHWVGAWASAPLLDAGARHAEALLTPSQPGITLREVVHLSIGGKTVRVRFSNLYGTSPLVIGAARIAQTLKGAAIVAGTDKALSFHGQPTVSIPPGALVVSDPAPFLFAPLSDLTVSFYLPSPSGPITGHLLGNATSYHAPGNAVSSSNLENSSSLTSWEYLNGVDTLASASAAAVVTIGDSITDGWQSTLDGNRRWPDELARRLQADPAVRNRSVLNEAIDGNKILRDGDSTGVSALARFDRDVLAQSGVQYLLVLEGINDIGQLHFDPTSTTAAELISALHQMIVRGHAHGIAVIGCTLTPYHGSGYYTENGEAIRKAVNDWIRTGGAFDGFVDLDRVVRDPHHPDTLLPALDLGDHVHPNNAGYLAMGDAIDLKLLTIQPRQP